MDTASKASLENEFATSNDDECIIKILDGGTLQQSQVISRPRSHGQLEPSFKANR